MEMYGKIKCVTYDELVPDILSKPNYDKYSRLKKLNFVQKGGNGRKVLIVYECLPADVRKKYDELFPHAEDAITDQLTSDMIQQDNKAIDFFRRYQRPNGNGLTDKKQEEYVLNAEVMNELIRLEGHTRSLHSKSGYRRPKIVWEIVVKSCEKMRVLFGHTLPGSEDRLRRSMNRYRKEGYASLVSGKVGNQNTRKIGQKEARLLIKLRRCKFPVYTEMQIFEEFNRRAAATGLNVLKSANSVRNYLFDPSVMPLWYASVFGELEFRKKYVAQFKTELPQLRDALWYADGTKLNLYYQENGKMKTTSVYEVMDAYSEVMLGYDIAPTESFDSQFRAFRMAINRAGVKPYEIVTDNQGGHKKLVSQGLFKKICRLHKSTMPYNGQSKTIESAFGRMQEQVLHKIWHFTGQNITATKKNSRPNIELIEANKDKLPTLEEVKVLYAELREEWNNLPHYATGLPRMEMYAESVNPVTTPITELDKIQAFWLLSAKPVTYTNQGIKFAVNKKTYNYEVYDEHGLRDDSFALKYTGDQLYIKYDPQDMTLVHLLKKENDGLVLVSQATTRLSIHRATQERTIEEEHRMRAQLENNKLLRAAMVIAMEDFDIEEGIAAEYSGLVTPKPKGISQKDMDKCRESYNRGKLKSPVAIPEMVAVADEPEEFDDPQTVGEWSKSISNMTFDEVSLYESRC